MKHVNPEAVRKLRKLGERLRAGLAEQYVVPRAPVTLPDVYKDVVRDQYRNDVKAGRIIPPPEKPQQIISTKPAKRSAKKKARTKSS